MDTEWVFEHSVVVDDSGVVEDVTRRTSVVVDAVVLLRIGVESKGVNEDVFVNPDIVVILDRKVQHEGEAIADLWEGLFDFGIGVDGIVRHACKSVSSVASTSLATFDILFPTGGKTGGKTGVGWKMYVSLALEMLWVPTSSSAGVGEAVGLGVTKRRLAVQVFTDGAATGWALMCCVRIRRRIYIEYIRNQTTKLNTSKWVFRIDSVGWVTKYNSSELG